MRLSEELTKLYEFEYKRNGDLCILINHAVALAREAEFEADKAGNLAQTNTIPAYPPWIRMLHHALVEV